MKSKTFKKLLTLFCITTLWIVTTAVFITIQFGNSLGKFIDERMAYLAAGAMSIVYSGISLIVFKGHMAKLYDAKLREDALIMAKELRNNHLGNPTKIDELIKTIKGEDDGKEDSGA